MAAKPVCPPIEVVQGWIAKLTGDLEHGERAAIYSVLRAAVPHFGGDAEPQPKQ